MVLEVQVEHDYNAKEPDELTIKKGDIITDVIKKPGGWWEGVLHDKKGVFPDNFVKAVDKDTQQPKRKDSNSSKSRQCRVLFSYDPDHEDELAIKVDDIIEVIGEEEEGWWRGVLNGQEGVFPCNFVEEIKPSSKPRPTSREDIISTLAGELNSRIPTLPTKPHKVLCEVKYSYKAQNEDELTLKEGEIVTLLSKDGQDIGWWKGELNGKIGVFPDNFVAVIQTRNDEKFEATKEIAAASLKPSSIVSQRKSLENKQESVSSPPVPGKKPAIISLKKSPSGSGIISGLKKKIADVVDGTGISKSKTEPTPPPPFQSDDEINGFDQVERRPLLADLRATRAKAPGRRPPSTLLKDFEIGEVNDGVIEQPPPTTVETQIVNNNNNNNNSEAELNGGTTTEVKPALREWEKHKAPWLEEMKLNQAKRTSTSPGPEPNKLKLTPTEIDAVVEPVSPVENNMSKSMPAALLSKATTAKTSPPNEEKCIIIRPKPKVPLPSRPQTISSVLTEQISNKPIVVSPVITNRSPSPMLHNKPPPHDFVTYKEHSELLERLHKLEDAIKEQNRTLQGKIEELNNKLQVESDLRKMLQLEVDKFSSSQTALN